jgi:pimeloyl-ACP methyl ester carboxylesterase
MVVLAVLGCVPRYATAPTMEFADVPYAGEAPWPVSLVEVTQVPKTLGMARPFKVAVAELNPEGTTTLVFVHGLGSSMKFWLAQLETFAHQGYRVLAIDLPGYGKSDKPATFPYTTEAFGDVVVEVLQQKGVTHPVLIGHSMGGQTMLSLAIRYPDLPQKLVLVSPAGFELFSDKEKEWFRRVFSRELVEKASEIAVWGSVRGNNFRRWRPELEWLIEERMRVVHAKDFDAYAYANVKSVAGLTADDFVRENLGLITAPTLIVYGEDDHLIPNPYLHGGFTRWVMSYGAEHITGSKLVGLERCGHTLQLDCPEEFNRELAAFVPPAH